MRRRIVGIIALIALAGLALGVYGRFVREPPPPPEGPRFTDDQKPLPPADEFEQLAKTDPVAMLAKCLARYEREVKGGVTATLLKQERVGGEPKPDKDPPEEVISLFVRGDVPDPATGKPAVEVLMKWQSGARTFLGSEIKGTLYSERPGAEGTGGKVVTWRPKATFKTNAISINDPLARGQSRYCIRDAGLYRGMLRTYDAWKQRKEAGTLHAEYLGKRFVEKAGRECYIVRRTCPSPEVDAFELGGEPDLSPKNVAEAGFTQVTVMIDAERWLQVGSELHRVGPDGRAVLIGSYYFRDVNTNPTFAPDTFDREGLLKR